MLVVIIWDSPHGEEEEMWKQENEMELREYVVGSSS